MGGSSLSFSFEGIKGPTSRPDAQLLANKLTDTMQSPNEIQNLLLEKRRLNVLNLEWEAAAARKQFEVDAKLLRLGVLVDGVASPGVKRTAPGVVGGGEVAGRRGLPEVKREKRGRDDFDGDEEIEILDEFPPRVAGKLQLSSFHPLESRLRSCLFSFHLVPGSGPLGKKRARVARDGCQENAGEPSLSLSTQALLPTSSSPSPGVKQEPFLRSEAPLEPEEEMEEQEEEEGEVDKKIEECCAKVHKHNLTRHQDEVHKKVRRRARGSEKKDRSQYKYCSLCRLRYADIARHMRAKHSPQVVNGEEDGGVMEVDESSAKGGVKETEAAVKEVKGPVQAKESVGVGEVKGLVEVKEIKATVKESVEEVKGVKIPVKAKGSVKVKEDKLKEGASRFPEMLLNTKENAAENEMPILPPFVEQGEEEGEAEKKKTTEPELEEKVEAAETNKEEKVEGKEKGGNVHVDLTSSKYFAKHPKAIANPQERSVSQSYGSNYEIKTCS